MENLHETFVLTTDYRVSQVDFSLNHFWERINDKNNNNLQKSANK